MEKLIVESTDKTNNPDKYALFIGRWQPFHEGHQWLIDQKLKHGKRVCIAIRDVPQDDKNWWSSDEIQKMLEERFDELIVNIINYFFLSFILLSFRCIADIFTLFYFLWQRTYIFNPICDNSSTTFNKSFTIIKLETHYSI